MGGDTPDGIDEVRTRFHARRLAQLIGNLDSDDTGARLTHKGNPEEISPWKATDGFHPTIVNFALTGSA